MVKMTEAEYRAEAIRKHNELSTHKAINSKGVEAAVDRLVERAKRLGLIEG